MNKPYIGCSKALLKRAVLLAGIQVFVSFGIPAITWAQAIQITAPTLGTVLTPGQQFTVTVSVAQGASFDQIFVVPQGLPGSASLSAPPYTFTFIAPGGGLTGPLTLTAVGMNGNTPIFSQPVIVNIEESASSANELNVTPPALALQFVGAQLPLIITATFADGTVTDVTQSPRTAYTSSNASVAQVNSNGLVTGTGQGKASITITYGALSATVPLTVTGGTRGDLNGDGKVDIDDINILDAALNSPATTPNDARDLNHDGVINALDARILVTLCTYPRCVSHP